MNPRNFSNGKSVLPKRVFIEGCAGAGKTTLCKKIIHDHLSQGMWREQFDLILWIPLRRLKGLSNEALTLESVLYALYFSELTRGMDTAAELAQTLLDPSQKDKILLILDGLDEVSQEWEPETPMQNLLLRLLDHSRVIITSRPYGMGTGLGILDSFDLELETVGFTSDQVHSYIRKIADQESQEADDILSFVQSHELIKGLVRIPIQLDAVCYSWHRNFLSKDQPKTMTALYQAITLKLLQKDVLRLEKLYIHKHLNQHNINGLSTFQVQELASKEMKFVELLAFTGMRNEIIKFNADDRRRIYDILGRVGLLLPDEPEAILRKISFLHTSDITVISPDQSYHFLHLTYQQFFAARYFYIKDYTPEFPPDEEIYPTI
ncbi:NACHT domain-containing protein [Aspergillus spectabilis]